MPNTHEMLIKPVRAARITDTTGALLGESRGRRKPRNTVKHNVFEHFLNILRKIHIHPSTGFDRGSTGGIPGVQQKGRRQGARAYITFGYHRRPPARTRARGRRPDLRGLRLTAGRRWQHGANVRQRTAT